MQRSLTNWWDSVELWITQLPFPFQVALAIVVLLPLCAGVAALADLASDAFDLLVARLRTTRRQRVRERPREGGRGGTAAKLVAGD